jgi:hypothetical protein
VGCSIGDFTPGAILEQFRLFLESPDFESKVQIHHAFLFHSFCFELHHLQINEGAHSS